MDEMRQLSPETRAALVALAQGSCQFPGCRTPILVFLGDDLEVNVETVRIRDTDPAGPRYVAGTTPRQRDSIANLLLLCVPHRRILDRDEKAHPIELIETWRTRVGDDPVDELGPMTPQRLDDLLTTAFATAREQVDEALTRFAKTEPDAARLLGAVMDDLHRQRGRYGADHRLASALTQVLDALTEQPRRTPRPDRVNVGWRSGRC